MPFTRTDMKVMIILVHSCDRVPPCANSKLPRSGIPNHATALQLLRADCCSVVQVLNMLLIKCMRSLSSR